MTQNESGNSIPNVYFYPSLKLDLTCPTCGFEATVILKENLTKDIKATCRKCKNKFLIKPNIRESYRKPLFIDGNIARSDMGRGQGKTVVPIKVNFTDISATGIGVTIPNVRLNKHKLFIGETLHASFPLPGRKSELHVKGKLMFIRANKKPDRSHLGIEFKDLDGASEQNIRFFMM